MAIVSPGQQDGNLAAPVRLALFSARDTLRDILRRCTMWLLSVKRLRRQLQAVLMGHQTLTRPHSACSSYLQGPVGHRGSYLDGLLCIKTAFTEAKAALRLLCETHAAEYVHCGHLFGRGTLNLGV